jgi:hypothetical protein
VPESYEVPERSNESKEALMSIACPIHLSWLFLEEKCEWRRPKSSHRWGTIMLGLRTKSYGKILTDKCGMPCFSRSKFYWTHKVSLPNCLMPRRCP